MQSEALGSDLDRIGRLLRYGIPDFKLDKRLIDRRMAQMRAEGVEFHTNSHVGIDIPARQFVVKTIPDSTGLQNLDPFRLDGIGPSLLIIDNSP